MPIRDKSLSRRGFVAGAGLGLGSGLLAGSTRAQAATPASRAESSAKIWSGEYWAKKGDVSLYMLSLIHI